MAVKGDPKSDSSEDQRLASKADAETGVELEWTGDLNVQTAMTQYTNSLIYVTARLTSILNELYGL